MKYLVHYESNPGMWELYSGTKTVEADSEEVAIDIAYRLLRRDFPERTRRGWHFTVKIG